MTKDLPNRYVDGNMHPADALASVREQIAELKKVEAKLRDDILADTSIRRGDLYLAEVVSSEQNRICQKKIKELIGDVEKVKKPTNVTFVRVFKIGEQE
jgi:hypothetical protein